ncbi:MAG: ribonuclease HII [Amoebophilaceae bacterium]|nr:ribonuclease HII [Amoebophilaceae bacterium]
MLQPYFSNTLTEAGCDEVGRGCLAGPVVAAAVILPKSFFHPLLNDSKQLTPAQRQLLSEIIRQRAVAWAVGEASAQEIDQYNILRASYLAMHRAIALLQPPPALLLIDGNCFRHYLKIPHRCIVKGDAKLAPIAAASVLAKTHRDALMHQLAQDFPGYGWESNVGYPTRMHRRAIQKLGTTPHHRRSFRLAPFHDSTTGYGRHS